MKKQGNVALYLLITFVILLAIVSVMCWVTFNNIKNTKKKVKQSNARLEQTQLQLKEAKKKLNKISNLVGFYNTNQNNKSRCSDTESIIYRLDSLRDQFNLIDGRKIDIDNKIKNGKEFDKSLLLEVSNIKKFNNLEDIYNECQKQVKKLIGQKKAKEDFLLKKEKKYQTVLKEKSINTVDLYKNINNKRTELISLKKEHTRKIKDQEKLLANLQQKKIDEKKIMAKLIQQKYDQKYSYRETLKNLEYRINALQTGINQGNSERKSGDSQDEADGEIIYVDNNLEIGYINLGKTDGILKGMSFEIFTYTKGGVQNNKGKIVVKEVRKNMSKVAITNIENKLNPIKAGDKIINRVYQKGKIKYFALAGEFSQKYSLEQVRRIIKQIGGEIEGQITINTDIVILGKNFRKDPKYRKARERGIETMLETEFLDYLAN